MKAYFNKVIAVLFFTILAAPFNKSYSQQEGAYYYNDGLISDYWPHLIELDAGRNLMVKYSRYGFDSSYVSLMWLDHSGTVLNHNEHRLTAPLSFLMDAIKMGNGFLLGGVMPNASSPFLMKMDTSGNVLRIDHFYSLGNENIYRLLKRTGTAFSAYASSPLVYSSTIRLDGSMNDTVYRFHRIGAPSGYSFRLYSVLDDGNNKDIMAGAISSTAVQLSAGFLMKLDTVNVDWVKAYDFPNYTDEYVAGITKLTNGNYIFVTQGLPSSGGVNYDSFITVADAFGNPVWSKQVAISNAGVLLSSVIETASGDLLVAGNSSAYSGIVLKLSSSGTLLWKKSIPSAGGIVITGELTKRQSGELALTGYIGGNSLLIQMDAGGSNCIFENDTLTTVTAFTPAVTSVPAFAISLQTKNTGPGLFSSRNLTPVMSPLCLGNSVQSLDINEEAVIYPNPASDHITIDLGNPVQYAFLLEITDVAGKIINTEVGGPGESKRTISVRNLTNGVYFITLTTKDSILIRKHFVIKK